MCQRVKTTHHIHRISIGPEGDSRGRAVLKGPSILIKVHQMVKPSKSLSCSISYPIQLSQTNIVIAHVEYLGFLTVFFEVVDYAVTLTSDTS